VSRSKYHSTRVEINALTAITHLQLPHEWHHHKCNSNCMVPPCLPPDRDNYHYHCCYIPDATINRIGLGRVMNRLTIALSINYWYQSGLQGPWPLPPDFSILCFSCFWWPHWVTTINPMPWIRSYCKCFILHTSCGLMQKIQTMIIFTTGGRWKHQLATAKSLALLSSINN